MMNEIKNPSSDDYEKIILGMKAKDISVVVRPVIIIVVMRKRNVYRGSKNNKQIY